ncbi:LysE family translocator [Falsiroseomonas sp. HW251]|uniref:LysE family translocator n=1 Tax=Falsiroseomonas sp. HW251 TaxID=3390998 RepID=UPI003D31C58A
MEILALLGFALALAVSTASPGPTIASLLSRVVGGGPRGIGWFCLGLLVGDAIWLAAAVFGLALLAEAAQPLFLVLKWLGVAYLAWLAWRLWTAPAEAPGDAPPPSGEGGRLVAAGIVLTLGNPKTMLFYTALTPTLLDVRAVGLADLAVLLATLAVVYGAVLAAYVALAVRARRLFRSRRAVRRINQACGAAMAGAAVTIAAR